MPRKPWDEIAREIAPKDDGRVLTRLRIWNIRNHFAITWGIWIALGAMVWAVIL